MPPRNLDRFLEHPGYGVEKISRFNSAWLDALRSHSDCLVFSYQEARADEERTFARILDFLGADSSGLCGTVEESSFHRMQQVEKDGPPKSLGLKIAIPGDPDSAKVRRGKIHGYLDYLDPPQADKYRAVAARYGFEA